MKIAVIGLGYVGLGVATSFLSNGHEVTGIDINKDKIDSLNNGIVPINEPDMDKVILLNKERVTFSTDCSLIKTCKVVFICVNTPENKDWSVDTSAIDQCVKEVLNNASKNAIIVIKSTVPVGYSKKVNEMAKERGMYVVFIPEFLRQGSAYLDSIHPNRIVVGLVDDEAKNVIEQLYKPFNAPIIFTNFESAELSKYASNNFLAMKISFINQIANFANVIGANIDDVKAIMEMDPRIGKGSLNPGVGFGGGCFVKDTKALYKQSEEANTPITLAKETISQNERQKYILLNELSNLFNGLENLKETKILVLGVSFKASSSDIRNSITIDNLKVLERFTSNFDLYDPILNGKEKERLPYHFINDLEKEIKQYDVLLIFTELKEINNLPKVVFVDKIVLDGRNVLDKEKAKAAKYYFSIGRGDF